jgi:hypothetical protein
MATREQAGKKWSCPVCGSSITARVYSRSLHGTITVPAQSDMRVLAYRCQNGHISLASDKAVGEPSRAEVAA